MTVYAYLVQVTEDRVAYAANNSMAEDLNVSKNMKESVDNSKDILNPRQATRRRTTSTIRQNTLENDIEESVPHKEEKKPRRQFVSPIFHC